MVHPQLSAFLCVADCGSFSKAAEKLFVSPTAVMKQMNLLEEYLGVTLLLRTNHGVRLTPAGESIYKDAKFMISYSDKALERARLLSQTKCYTICVGTSMLNPCKVFMDLWYHISDQFPQYKIHIVPFEDNHDGILSVIGTLGKKFDFLVAVCDSERWMSLCNFYPLGTYERCCAVPMQHRLACKERLQITDLYGETLMMVKRGDSPINDHIRDEIERNHPEIHIEDAPHFYDIEVFNHCERMNYILSSIECWKDIHPSFVTIQADWETIIPYGLLYALHPPEDILRFVEAIKISIIPASYINGAHAGQFTEKKNLMNKN